MVVVLLVALASSSRAGAQTPAAAQFEVASVRPNNSGSRYVTGPGEWPGGSFRAINVTFRELIRYAFALEGPRMLGGPRAWPTYHKIVEGLPAWADQRFDVVAKATETPPLSSRGGGLGPFPLMVQRLLAERFKLVTHRVVRQKSGYALVMARSDRRLGRNLRPSTLDCAAHVAGLAERARLRQAPRTPEDATRCTFLETGGRFTHRGVTMTDWAAYLESRLEVPVEDRTGLKGPFSIDLAFNVSSLSPLNNADVGPALETALVEELGLKLQRVQIPVDVLVIDRVERPTAN